MEGSVWKVHAQSRVPKLGIAAATGWARIFYADFSAYSPNISQTVAESRGKVCGLWTTATLQTHALTARCPETTSPATVNCSTSVQSWGFRDCRPGIPKVRIC